MTVNNCAEEGKSSLTTEEPVKIVVGLKKGSVVTSPRNIETKKYARRWLVLGIYIIYAAGNFSQWLQYSIISNIVSRYYDVSAVAVSWTSMVFMLVYIIQIFPCSYLMDRIGLRWTVILGSLCTCFGSWLKVCSVSPDRFYLSFIGQTISASGQIFVITVPGRLAAAWFGSDQVSTATSIGLFGCQLGIAASFIIPPLIVRNHESLDDIGDDLWMLFWSSAIFMTVATVAVVLFFKDEPPLPPSVTRALQKVSNSKAEGLLAPTKRLLTNWSYLALCNSFGILIGVSNAVSTLLNQLYLIHFENGEAEAGQIGLIIIITGMFGNIIFGIILDKTHMFKETISAVFVLTLLGQIVFAVALLLEIKWMVYVSAGFLGFFITGYFSVGYEVCAEFTYPESDAAATGILNITNQVYGVLIVLIASKVLEMANGDFWAHLIIILILLVGAIITLLTKDLQRRQYARNNAVQYSEVPVADVIKSINAL